MIIDSSIKYAIASNKCIFDNILYFDYILTNLYTI
jgi:hypothetical protein